MAAQGMAPHPAGRVARCLSHLSTAYCRQRQPLQFNLPQSCLMDMAALCKGKGPTPCSDLQALLWAGAWAAHECAYWGMACKPAALAAQECEPCTQGGRA